MSLVFGLPNNSYKHIAYTAWVCAQLCKLQKGSIRPAAASDKVYQLLAHGRWFSPGTPASSTTKIGRHDIVEILLKVALNTINQIKIKTIIHVFQSNYHDIYICDTCTSYWQSSDTIGFRCLNNFPYFSRNFRRTSLCFLLILFSYVQPNVQSFNRVLPSVKTQ